jgi:5'-methylthioadenosine phosphorylase
MAIIGVIGGSGLYEIQGLALKHKEKVKTPYGDPSEHYFSGTFGNKEIIFLPRHGKNHCIPPHMINYRANMWGFKKLGVERILSVSAVGGIKKGLKPKDVVILDQILDMTRGRESSFYDGKNGVVHIDFTEPYCPEMRKVLLKAGKLSNVHLKNGGTYVAVEGPRLESASEIKSFGILGGDVVGMTGMPEAALARELEMCYSGLSVVANFAAGISKEKLTVQEVMEAMTVATEKIKRLFRAAIPIFPDQRKCPCKEALKDAAI